MPSPKPGRKRGAEYQIFGAACGRDSRERESKRALFEHDPYIITGGPMAGRTAENDCGCERMVPASVRIKRDCGNQGQLVAVVSWTLTVGACAAAQANVRQRT